MEGEGQMLGMDEWVETTVLATTAEGGIELTKERSRNESLADDRQCSIKALTCFDRSLSMTSEPLPSDQSRDRMYLSDWISLTREGHHIDHIRFYRERGHWYAEAKELMGELSRTASYPVLCDHDLRSYLPRLMNQSNPSRRIRLMEGTQRSTLIVGEIGLLGGGERSLVKTSLERTVSSALFKILTKSTITSTKSLVQELNTNQSLGEKRILLEWMQGYISWFSNQQIDALTTSLLQEYSLLGDIRSDDAITGELVHQWFCSLCNRLHRGLYGEGKLIEAINAALQSIDRRVFRDDPSLLIKLANELLSKLDPSVAAFTRETYPTQSAVLFALYRTLVTMEQIAPRQLDVRQSDGLYQKFRRRLMAIVKVTEYYPFMYHAQLIESCLHRLKSESKWMGQRRLWTGALGALYIFRGFRSLLNLDLDVEAFELGFERLHHAFTDLQTQRAPWYDWIQALGNAAQFTFSTSCSYTYFDSCYQIMKNEMKGLRQSENLKALRFGIILQLQMVALYGSEDETRNRATAELVSLAERCKMDDGWIGDPEIVEALMEALATIYQRHPSQQVSVALELLISVEDVAAQTVIQAWLQHGTLDERMKKRPIEAIPESGTLFRLVRKELLSIVSDAASSSPGCRQMRQMLEEFYQRPQFTKIEPLFEGEPEMHIVSVQCELMLLEQKKIKEDESEEEEPLASSEQEHHLWSHYERLEWVKTAIPQASLFHRRSLEPDGPEREIHRVLITGDPGTGKTTLARHLTFGWATGEWGQEFGCVFFLQVRELQASKYNDANERREETLATAIANNCFPRQDKDAFISLRQQIEEVLKDPTTLVILDGLDECAGASQVIIDEAKDGKHKLVMLARPYGVQNDRSLADIEVVQLGLNDAQLEELIGTELPPDQARELIDYIRVSPDIWNIAHIPVNATILCTLWKDPHLNTFKHSSSSSLSVLYRRITHFTWERYVLKMKQEGADVIEVFDTLGSIAYEALMQGQILIDEWLVQDHARTSQMKRIIRESGFLLFQSIGLHYQFPHLTFQEYFAGRWLARQFCRGTTDEIATVEEILVHQKYDAELKMVFSFMMGEVSLMRGSKGTERMMEQINREPRDVIGVQHLLLELRLINDHLAVKKTRTEVMKFDAVDRLKGLMVSCTWEYTLVSLLIETLKSLPSLVQSYPELLDPLMEMCEWSSRFRTLAFKTIKYLLVYVPDHLGRVVDFMESLFCRSDEEVREEIVQFMQHLLPAFADRIECLLPLIRIACVDKCHSIRESAIKGMATLLPFVSANDEVILREKLMTGCIDELYTVRKAALKSIDDVISMDIRHIPVFLKTVVTTLWDPYECNRDAAMALCKKIILTFDDAPGIIVELLQDATEGTSGIAQYAFVAIGELLPSMPQCYSMLMDVLLDGSAHWSSSVREATIQTIGKVIQLDPTVCQKFQPAIEDGLDATAYVVRKASIKSLGDVAKHCIDADLDRIEAQLMKGFSDQEFLVRLATVEAVGEVTKLIPDRIENYIDSLKSASRDEVYTVRKASIEVFGEILTRREEQAEDLMETLTAACNDPYTHVRKSALESIGRVLRHSPEYLDQLMNALRGYTDRNTHGRKGAVDTVAELLRLAPDRTPELVELLMEVFDDPNHHVRMMMLQTLGSIEEFPESQVSHLASKLFSCCLDDTPIVRNVAMERTKEILEKHPEVSLGIFDAVRKSTIDHDTEHRRVAFLIMGELLRHHPDLIPVCIPLIRRGCRDEIHYIREAALLVLQRVMEIDRVEFSKLMDLISSARDGGSRVRATAVKLLTVAMDVAPDVFEDFLDEAVDSCYDRSFFVCKCAFQLADKAIVQRPELIPKFLPPLLEAFHQSSQQRRHNSKEIIQRIPLETLMECYWDAPWREGLAFVLVTRLYHVSLTMRRSARRYKLILHQQATRAIEWDKSEEETTSLMDMLHDVYERRINNT